MPNVTLEDFANTRQKLSYCFPQKAITSTNKMKNVTPLDIPNSQFYMRARPLEGHRSILMMSLHMAATVLPCTGIEQLFCWSICPVVITAPGLTLANTHRYCGSQKKPGVLNIKKTNNNNINANTLNSMFTHYVYIHLSQIRDWLSPSFWALHFSIMQSSKWVT